MYTGCLDVDLCSTVLGSQGIVGTPDPSVSIVFSRMDKCHINSQVTIVLSSRQLGRVRSLQFDDAIAYSKTSSFSSDQMCIISSISSQ